MQIGSWADWFSAVGTVGALIAAIGVILSDRRGRARAQAQRVIVQYTSGYDGNEHTVEVLFYNGSEQPIMSAAVFQDPPRGPRRDQPIITFDEDGLHPIRPGETQRALVRGRRHVRVESLVVFFRDGDGRSWARPVRGGRLLTNRQGMRIARGYDPSDRLSRRFAWWWSEFLRRRRERSEWRRVRAADRQQESRSE